MNGFEYYGKENLLNLYNVLYEHIKEECKYRHPEDIDELVGEFTMPMGGLISRDGYNEMLYELHNKPSNAVRIFKNNLKSPFGPTVDVYSYVTNSFMVALILDMELSEIPLYIDSYYDITRLIAKWRLEIGK